MALWTTNSGWRIYVNFDWREWLFKTKDEEFTKVSWVLTWIETRSYKWWPKKDKDWFGLNLLMEDWEEKYQVQFWFNWISNSILNSLQNADKEKIKEPLFLTVYQAKDSEYFNVFTALWAPDKDHSLSWKDNMEEFIKSIESKEDKTKFVKKLAKDLWLNSKEKEDTAPAVSTDVPF